MDTRSHQRKNARIKGKIEYSTITLIRNLVALKIMNVFDVSDMQIQKVEKFDRFFSLFCSGKFFFNFTTNLEMLS